MDQKRRFIKIRDLYFLLVITCIKIASCFPSSTLKMPLVKSITFAAYQFSRHKRRLSEHNIARVLDGTLSADQQQRLVKGTFSTFWQDTFSLVPSHREQAALKSVNISGIEYLHRALQHGKGVILWESSFFGQRNLAKQILHEHGFPVCQVHLTGHLGGFFHNGNSWIQGQLIKPFFEKAEESFLAEIIYLPRSGSLAFTRILLHRLQQNAMICIAGDAKFGQKLISRKFLDHTELFPTGMASLAKISGAVILPMFCVRERDGQICLIIERPIRLASHTKREWDVESAVTQYVNLLDTYIRKYPEQYRRWHFQSTSKPD